MSKNPNLKYLEELIVEIQLDHDSNKNISNDIKRILNRVFKHNCVEVIINENNGEMFGMSIYPAEASLTVLATCLLVPEKPVSDIVKLDYILEIDSKILYDKMINLTAPEIVAMMLHEVGHIANITYAIAKMRENFTEAMTKERLNANNVLFDPTNIKRDLVNTTIAKMYILDFLENNKVQNGFSQIKIEKHADLFAKQYGYQEELASALEKFCKYYKFNMFDKNANYNSAVYYVKLLSITKNRSGYIRDLIANEKKMENRTYVKRFLDEVLKKFRKNNFGEPKYPIQTHLDDILQEGLFGKNVLKISQKNIDELRIEYEMIENYGDKMSLMYKIHKRLTQLSEAKEKLQGDKQKLGLISSYELQLSELLKKVMEYKVKEKAYGVFLKYPEGYEG